MRISDWSSDVGSSDLHEAITLLRKFLLLAAARVEGVQLLHRMAQEQLVALRLGEPPGRYLARLQRILPGPPQRAQVVRLGFQATVGVEQVAVGRRVHQAALVELALDLDQQRSDEHTSELQSLMRTSY